MHTYDLSILIPARNEMFLKNTVEDILKNIRSDTEVIVGLDGQWPVEPLDQHERVQIVYFPESIGQRAMTNAIAKISSGTYLMKVDAHCAFDEGFDKKMLSVIEPDMTLVPVMKNLHVFNWVCDFCGATYYQGPPIEECGECKGKEFKQDIVWIAKSSPNSTSYRFTPDLEFKYFPEYKKKQTGDLVETMSLQGSCFMIHRDKYFGLNVCDETWGSWGGQGAEVALKTWLSGGRVLCYKKTWYAHLFRTQKGFSHPYPNPANEQKNAKDNLRRIFLEEGWEHSVRTVEWLVNKFSPVPDWENGVYNNSNLKKFSSFSYSELSKGILYYTDNNLDNKYALPVQKQLSKIGLPIVSSSIKSIDFGNNVVVNREPGYMTMFVQIYEGLKKLKELGVDVVFFAEHDVIYHPSHFEFIPEKNDTFYYNQNVWKIHGEFGFALHYDCSQTSGLCGHIDLLLDHYAKRIEYINNTSELYDQKQYMKLIRRIGFEPGTHGRIPELAGKSDVWKSEYPNLDIRHKENLTPSRWRKDQFRNQRFTKGWTGLCESVPGWGKILGKVNELLLEVQND